MRIYLIPLLILLVFCIGSDVYIWRALGSRMKTHAGKLLRRFHLGLAVILYAVLAFGLLMPRQDVSDNNLLVIMWILFSFLAFYFPKILFCVLDAFAYIPKLWHARRAKWVSKTATVLSFVVFIALWWSALGGRYATQTREITVFVPDLPEEFENYKIVQFSDFHVGTYGTDTAYVSKVVDRINNLGADAVFFTGDIVNRHSPEIDPFVKPLSRLRVSDGVYAVLGNHDYGDYYNWDTPEEKVADRRHLLSAFDKMGWDLLLNQTRFIGRGNDSIAVIGVENIGDPPFPTYGNLTESYPGDLSDNVTKILLSHNPAHWIAEIEKNPTINIPLTLSGHTHAMQVELFGLSPAVFRYPKWGGLYSSETNPSKQLYVNIGLGTVAIPMRLGARPELTLITLTGKENQKE